MPITKLLTGLPQRTMEQEPFDVAMAKLMTDLPTWAAEANALEANVNAKEIATNADALATAADRVQTGLDRVATGQDRVATGQDRTAVAQDRALAQAAAVQIGTAAAFTDGNPVVKNAADNTKQAKFNLAGLPTGTTATINLEKSGTPLMTVDVDKSRAYYDQSNATNTFDYRVAGHQRWSPGTSGTQTLAITNWPAAPIEGTLILDVINGGAATLAFPAGAVFVTAGGTEVATFALSGITFPTSGRRRLLVWSPNGGTTQFFKGA